MLCDVVGADVDGRGGRGGDHFDGHGLAVGAGDAVGQAFGGLNDELEVGHVGRDAGHGEGEGLALAGDGGGAGVLDTDGRLSSFLREAGRGLTSTVSWRLWKGRSAWSNRLLTVTAFPIRETKGSSSLCCHMQKVL